MIMRRIVHAESCGPGARWNVQLECGHRYNWVRLAGPGQQRKRCHWCESIQSFAESRPGDYSTLCELSHVVPPEDRAEAFIQWISQEPENVGQEFTMPMARP